MRMGLSGRSGLVRWAVYRLSRPSSTALMRHSLYRTLIRANSAAGVLLMPGYLPDGLIHAGCCQQYSGSTGGTFQVCTVKPSFTGALRWLVILPWQSRRSCHT